MDVGKVATGRTPLLPRFQEFGQEPALMSIITLTPSSESPCGLGQ